MCIVQYAVHRFNIAAFQCSQSIIDTCVFLTMVSYSVIQNVKLMTYVSNYDLGVTI